MPRWSAERRDVPIARDVKTPRKRLRVPRKHAKGASQHPAPFGAPLPLTRDEGSSETKTATTEPLATAGGALAV